MSPILGILASSISPSLNASSYDSISTVTVGAGGTGTVTFSSIPGTYKHLQIRAIARSTAAFSESLIKMRMNSDSGTNYSFHYVRGNGSSTSAAGFSTQDHIRLDNIPETSQGTSVYAGLVIDILDYANTNKNKTTRTLSGFDANGAGEIVLQSGAWYSTSAITSITLDGTYDSGLFGQYSQFALYGIKG